jgi:hypothetical protein
VGETKLQIIGCTDGVPCTKYDATSVITAVKSADVALLFMGIDTSFESEGLDRTTLELPGNQLQLIKDAQSIGISPSLSPRLPLHPLSNSYFFLNFFIFIFFNTPK